MPTGRVGLIWKETVCRRAEELAILGEVQRCVETRNGKRQNAQCFLHGLPWKFVQILNEINCGVDSRVCVAQLERRA